MFLRVNTNQFRAKNIKLSFNFTGSSLEPTFSAKQISSGLNDYDLFFVHF